MISFPNAKINIGLHVVSKRSDGFHNIESCLYPIPFHDVLEIVPADKFSYHQYGIKKEIPDSENLIIRSYQLLEKKYRLPEVEIRLIKNIPLGSGLGGGSSNAASTLQMCNELFHLNLNSSQLKELALELGSDCPFFIENEPLLVSGRGEDFKPNKLNLSGFQLILVFPELEISTKKAFQNLQNLDSGRNLENELSKPISNWNESIRNDFQQPFFEAHPELKTDFDFIQSKSLYASLSGTGSTFYGIFKEKCELDIQQKHLWIRL